MDNLNPLTFILFCLIFGAIAAAIGQKKNLSVGQSFALGAFLGIIGLIIVIFRRPGLPKAPPGMRVVKCQQCNTIQNIPEAQPRYVCWQCKAVYRLCGTPPQSTPIALDAPHKLAPRQSTNVKCHKCQHVQAVPLSQPTFMCEQCNTRLKRAG